MVMDVHGLSPVIRKQSNSVLLKQVGDWGDHGWLSRWKLLSEDDKRKYSRDKSKHEKNNPGIYFSNNCWLWRPLWDFTCEYVGCLTEKDQTNGHYNNSHVISANKAKQIAITLKELLDDGTVDLYKAKWDALEGEQRQEAGLMHNQDDYPFYIENVIAFAEFCKDSGGFEIS